MSYLGENSPRLATILITQLDDISAYRCGAISLAHLSQAMTVADVIYGIQGESVTFGNPRMGMRPPGCLSVRRLDLQGVQRMQTHAWRVCLCGQVTVRSRP